MVAKKKQQQFRASTVFTDAQLAKFLNHIDKLKEKEQDYCLFKLIAHTGLRISEAAALTWDDVLLEQRIIRVRHGKGDKEREIYFGPKVLKILQQLRTMAPADAVRVFNGQRGALTSSGISKRYVIYRVALGLPTSLTVHSLRHYYATLLLNSGVTLTAIKDMLGHSSLSTTCHYLHLKASNIAMIQAVS